MAEEGGGQGEDEVPFAFVVLKPEFKPATNSQTSMLKDELTNFVAEKVAPFKRIRGMEFMDSLPKSMAGKVQRHILAKILLQKAQNSPRN